MNQQATSDTLVTEGLTLIHAVLDTIPTESYAALAPGEQVAACTQLARLEARVKAHQMAAARAVQDSNAADAAGATSTESLLAGMFGGDPGAAKRLFGQGKRIHQAGRPPTRSPVVRSASSRPS